MQIFRGPPRASVTAETTTETTTEPPPRDKKWGTSGDSETTGLPGLRVESKKHELERPGSRRDGTPLGGE